MNEAKMIVSKIESLKAKVNIDLIEISKHLEKLGKIMKMEQNSTAYLRCKGHMRIANAMIRGVGNLRMLLIEQKIEETAEIEETSENHG